MDPVPVIKNPVLEGAGTWRRGLARLVDLVLHNVLMLITVLVTAMFFGMILGLMGADTETLVEKISEPEALDYVFFNAGYLLYHAACEGFHGASLGKLLLGIHVLTEDVTPCTPGMAFKRSLGWLLDMLFFGLVGVAMMAASPLRQRLGDRWARTVVVQKSKYPHLTFPSGGRFLLAFGQGILLDVLMGGLLLAAKLF